MAFCFIVFCSTLRPKYMLRLLKACASSKDSVLPLALSVADYVPGSHCRLPGKTLVWHHLPPLNKQSTVILRKVLVLKHLIQNCNSIE